MKIHVENAHKRHNSFQCDICDKTFHTISYLKNHDRNVHQRRKLKCEKCEKPFAQKCNLIRHINTHNETSARISLSCKICGKVYYSKSGLELHTLSFHDGIGGNKAVKCVECNKTYSSNSSLKKHLKSHKSVREEFPCKVCNKTFFSEIGFQSHTQVVHENLTHKCKICDKVFKQKQNLRLHRMAEHELKQIKKKCIDCGRYISRKNIARHIQSIHKTSILPSKPFECYLCGKVLSSKRSVAHHIKFIHKEDLLVRVKCEKCDKSFASELNLKRHLKTHDNEREKAVCQICANTFVDEVILNQHIRKYHKDR